VRRQGSNGEALVQSEAGGQTIPLPPQQH
jgi:hypothetical protein